MQVQKIDVNYDKTSKQVDVRILKESLWSHLQIIHEVSIFLQWIFHAKCILVLCMLQYPMGQNTVFSSSSIRKLGFHVNVS